MDPSIKNVEMKNKDRFLGFADVYEQARPEMPGYPIEIITRYLNKKANIVVDLGCGSGLSTTAWKNHCNAIIGIEPSDDMFLDRILKSGGIFAVVDYDWPPVCKWEAELAHKQLFYIVSRLEEEHEDLKDDYIRWDKINICPISKIAVTFVIKEKLFLQTGSPVMPKDLSV
ncbi:hypothetical protein [Lacrimispora sp.]|uniref:hypothetical protein n=1 Tax=Lacrimispora sp. TaxID=2719234 RepID=UPI0028ADA5E8|nr:hypothetical protein [Lacrimispora sp.]